MDRPAQHPEECRCPECWTLSEFMHAETGVDYGIPRAPGCPHKHSEPNVVPLRKPDEPPAPRRGAEAEHNPWQPRAPRYAAARLRDAA